ncbi:DUF222 domain-containing protein [Nocardia huaxiensis]|uniref:DUF222 domain-containing protein n=1 Tax=Nocardia huaxiensis TaxID=2755382 RepID=A0A7D6VAR2_9NOCA|nr:HNH endonuclease signature motif containing protein [Nocardia huaxiensis]QLY27695.1 DUF222 domain-containing protein [Nocardia huaxiensis]
MRSIEGLDTAAADQQVGAAVAALLDAVDTLRELPLAAHSDAKAMDLLRATELATRKLVAFQTPQFVDLAERGVDKKAGVGSMPLFLKEALHLSSADAYARAHRAADCGQLLAADGSPRPVRLAHTAAAHAEGLISVDHIRNIATVMNRIPDRVDAAKREQAEQILAEYATAGSPDRLTIIGNAILARLDPDGTLTDLEDQARMRTVTLGHQRADGMSSLTGEIDPTLRAYLAAFLQKYARPGMCNPDDPHSPTTGEEPDTDVVREAAARDTRTVGQRNHDALVALFAPATRLDDLGRHRGLPVQAIITMTLDQLEERAGVATTATGGTVSIPEALKMAERSTPILALFDHTAGMPLHLERGKRLATPTQRLALIAAERGCTRPGCDAPASLTAVHHIQEWAKGGLTDLPNLTLACDRCHALVHDGPDGWKTVVMPEHSDYPGRTGWIAPAHIDPTRTPRVNHRHHADELLAQARTRVAAHTEQVARDRRNRLRCNRPETTSPPDTPAPGTDPAPGTPPAPATPPPTAGTPPADGVPPAPRIE